MSRCAACPVPACLPCYGDERAAYCDRAARPGEDAYRAMLVRHAEARANGSAPTLLSPEQLVRQRAAENCPHRDCVGCGCNGCRCRPEGRRPGRVVTIRDCLECVDGASTSRPMP